MYGFFVLSSFGDYKGKGIITSTRGGGESVMREGGERRLGYLFIYLFSYKYMQEAPPAPERHPEASLIVIKLPPNSQDLQLLPTSCLSA